ncbi:DinB family protein [Kitasatospora sp. KL5]|uniref:DinB family protein n=1 Tax=Kitasatospora sp. KL5 TaxID=3425125 RepID=UPI003D6DF27B
MTPPDDPKTDLRRYLQYARDALLWKLDGLSEYDIRRPLTPTGTNLLGLVKHAGCAEFGYLGDAFGRPSGEPGPLFGDGSEPNAHMWATADESREYIVERYRRAWAHTDATVEALPLDAVGKVPWWPSHANEVTLNHALVRVIADTHRHAGHADILRELLDGAVGMNENNTGMASDDPAWWEEYRTRLQHTAEQARRARP